MFYVKNVPGWERGLRVVAGAAALAGGGLLLGGWQGWALGAAGASLIFSGLVGWCPACAMVGRRLDAGR